MDQREFAKQIVVQLNQAGYQAYWAGGCVRDLLLGIEASDYDVATNAKPQDIRELFGHARTLAVGAAFGVIIVLSPDRQIQVEVATFRTDACYSDGRHPDSVTFSTPEMDAQRRDFTINGMFYDPIAEQVVDFVGGQSDLTNSKLRAIGDPDARISEDKLRMLRAIRFAARFSLDVDAATYQAVKRHAAEVASVSGERMAVELRKTLETSRPGWAVEQWADSGLLQVLLPEVAEHWSRNAVSITQMLCAELPNSWLARLAAMLWPSLDGLSVSEPNFVEACNAAVAGIKQRLKLSNEDSVALRFALNSQPTLSKADQLPWSQLQPLMISAGITTAVDLIELRSVIGQTQLHTVQWLRDRLSWPMEQLDPKPLVTGQDLMQLGLRPGPQFKGLLHQVRCQQLDGGLQTLDQATAWLNKEVEKDLRR